MIYEELFASSYRPLPPVIEISEIVDSEDRYGLLLESPEPLNWARTTSELRILDPTTGGYSPLAGMLTLFSDDGARVFLIPIGGDSLLDGEYELQLTCNLDIGLEAPQLRRSGSTLPEIGRLRFALS